MSKIAFLKSLDRVIGRPLSLLLPKIKSARSIPEVYTKILFIRPGGIGDAVLLLPAINSLKAQLPISEIYILCENRNAGIFALSNKINKVYLYDKGFELFQCLRNNYDVVIDTEQWHRLSAVVAYLTDAGIRIGFDTNERARLFTDRMPYSHDDYEVDSFLRLLEPLTGKVNDFKADEPFINVLDGSSTNPLLISLAPEDRVIAVFPGASVSERRWGGERFGKVSRVLSDKGFKILILGADANKEEAKKIKQYAPGCIDLTGRTNLRDVAFILKRCRLLITADSGLMHMAYAVGTPTISLFGPGIEKKWAPKGGKHIVLNKRLECSPCTRFGYTPGCEKNIECLSSISVGEVIDAAERILKA